MTPVYICNSRPSRTITDNSLSCSFRLRQYRAKCRTKPLRLPISIRHHTTSAQHSANSLRGRMDAPPAWRHACMFANHGSKPTSHQRLHCTMQLPEGERNRKGAPPAWRRARATLMTQTGLLSTTRKLKLNAQSTDTRAAGYRPLGTCI